MADHDHHDQARDDATRKRLADEKAARDKRQAAAREGLEGSKPTPTQEENDLAASGVKVELEPDGSPEQPPAPPQVEPGQARKTDADRAKQTDADKAKHADADKTRQAEADRNRAGYSTRSTDAKT
jgi:hypothetical protein